MIQRSKIVAGIQAVARSTPSFRGKYRLFRSLYRVCRVPDDQEFRLRMRGITTPVHVRLGSLLESRVLCQGDYEPNSSRAIDRLVRPGWTCFDVGANVGLITVRLAERVGPTGRVVAVEANPALMPRLTANTAGLGNVTRVGAAIGDRAGEGLLAVNDPSVCANHNATMVGAREETGAIRVLVTTMDRLWSEVLNRGPVGFIKMDIEGYEFNALRGARDLLAAFRPAILMEFNRPYATAMGYTLEGVLNYLREFAPYHALGIKGSPLRPPTTEVLDVLLRAD